MWGPSLDLLTIVFVLVGLSPSPPVVYMIIILGPLWCSGIIPPPLSVWSVLSFMNMLTTYRTFVGIIMSCQRWGMINILRSWKHVVWRISIVFVGMILNRSFNQCLAMCHNILGSNVIPTMNIQPFHLRIHTRPLVHPHRFP